MFRLIKFGMYALLGYAMFEFFAGLRGGRRCPLSESRDLNRALNRASGRMQTLTGPGLGAREATLDRDGGMIPHQVGRGVVRR